MFALMENSQYKGSQSSGFKTPNMDLPSSFNLGGRNVGSAMFLRRGQTGQPRDGCAVNIYINSNVQGVNSSTVIRSKVKMVDPGVHLYFGDIGLESNREDTRRWTRLQLISYGALVFLVVTLFLLLVPWAARKPTAACG